MSHCSDYKDDGTNVLLDANENAYGPGLALNSTGKLATGAANGDSPSVEVDVLGLNRYPDPYASLPSPRHVFINGLRSCRIPRNQLLNT